MKQSIVSIINQIDKASGKAKLDILAQHKDNELLEKFLVYANSPLHTFGIKRLSTSSVSGIVTIETLIKNGSIEQLISTNPQRLTGNEAYEFCKVLCESLTPEDQILFVLMLNKGIKCGLNITSINKVYGYEMLYDTTKHYMRCSAEKDVKNFNYAGAFVQEKMDGAYIELNTGTSVIQTRAGSVVMPDVTQIPSFNVEPCTLLGEILFTKDGKIMPREDSNGILNSLIAGNTTEHKMLISVYDVKGGHTTEMPYYERLAYIEKIVSELGKYENNVVEFQLTETTIVNTKEEAVKIANKYIADGKEGAIVKEANMVWKAGTSKQQIKLKVEAECDLRIVELVPGDAHGKHKDTFGSILCESECERLMVNVSGISDKQRKEIFDNFDSDWRGKIVTVKYNSITENGNSYSLFLPRFSKDSSNSFHVRDKEFADTLEEIQKAYDSLIKG